METRLLNDAGSTRVAFLKHGEAADEIRLAAAWVTEADELSLLVRRRAQVREAVIGTDSYGTSPDALSMLRGIARRGSATATFHPKLYVFTKAAKFACILGSSNLTRGGFERNVEVNALIEGSVNDAFYSEVLTCIHEMHDDAVEIEPEYIERYRTAFEQSAAARAELRRSEPSRSCESTLRGPPPERWDRASFMEYVLDSGVDHREVEAFEWLLDLCERLGQPSRWGAGTAIPTLQIRAGTGAGRNLVNVYGSGEVVVGLHNVRELLGRTSADELRDSLNQLPGVEIASDNYRSPNLPVSLFASKESRLMFARASERVLQAVQAAQPAK